MRNYFPSWSNEDPEMARTSEARKSADRTLVQVVVGHQTLNLIEAYRKAAGFSSRAQAARALIVKGLLRDVPQAE
jgi:hypothetical protein